MMYVFWLRCNLNRLRRSYNVPRSIEELDDWVWVEFSRRADGYYPPSAPNFLSPLIFFILFLLK